MPFGPANGRRSKPYRTYVSAEAFTALSVVASSAGISKKAALSMMVHSYCNGPAAQLRRDIRGHCQAIAVNARIDFRESVGGTPRAARMLAIEKAAIEIPAMLGDGDDGARVGQVIVIPRSDVSPAQGLRKEKYDCVKTTTESRKLKEL